jgi:legumain
MRSAILASSVAAVQGAHWAVLVAGSNTYSNYRHQADVCHAYQVVKSKGVPESNIIVMAYDDIANSRSNPYPGKLFNKPTASGTPGVDVYSGCKIDYSGSQVTPANFEAVLTGTASGKSLKSTSEDEVFIFFSDHGAAGLIAFPSGQMHSKDLQSTFATMHSKNMYKKLVMYLETCESGSMFQGMTTPGVYALSASSPTESSWGTYCGSDAKVNGKSIGSCLGDLFSIAWMEESDVTDLTKESLDTQFGKIKTRTSKSAVMQWGDLSFKTDMASEFIGTTDAETEQFEQTAGSATSWNARQLDLQQAYHNYVNAETTEERLEKGAEMQQILADQLAVEQAYEKFLDIVYPGDEAKKQAIRTANAAPLQRDCEIAARENFIQHGAFDSFTGFSLQFHKFIVNVCADVAKSGANIDVADAAKRACLEETVV